MENGREDRPGASHTNHPHDNRRPDPTPPYVYWIRRAVALLILVALIAIIVLGIKAIAARFSKDEEPEVTASQSAKPDKKDTKAEEPTDDGTSPKSCEPNTVTLSLNGTKNSVAAGTSLSMNLNVKNESEESCILDVSPTHTVVTVYSGNDRIWSNDDCDDTGTKALFMDAKAETTTAVNWDGIRSDKKCSSNLPAVKAGTYRAVADYKGSESEEFVFNVK
jgi:cytoskeletal protein RodZ